MALWSRTLGVILTADTRAMERGLDRAERRLRTFGKASGGKGSGLASLIGTSRGGLAVAGAGAVALGLHKMADASADAEIAQAKLRVALQNAGMSYEAYGKQIDAAITAQSKMSGFDDELLTDSFANMLRSTKDVNEALRLNALAADIARTKGVDLAGAQSLVARVYAGSFQGVKRLGIQFQKVTTAQDALRESGKKYTLQQMRQAKAVDDVASRTKAIAELQKAFGGQAKAYGDSSAGATDKFRVSLENLMETAGPGLRDLEETFVSLGTTMVEAFDSGLQSAQGFFSKVLEWESKLFPWVLKGDKTIELTPAAAKAAEGIRAPGEGRVNPNAPGATTGGRYRPTLTVEQNLLLARDRAAIKAGLADDLRTAKALVQFYKDQAANATNAKDRFAAEQKLVSAQRDYADILQSQADRAASDAEARKHRLKDAAEKALEAAGEFADKLREQAEGFKNALIAALDKKQDNARTLRDISDARDELARALQGGYAGSIKAARRNLEDAVYNRKRFLAESANVRQNLNGTFTININGATFNGVTDVKKFVALLDKMARRTATQSSGRAPGARTGNV